ncbi:MAG TPA: 2Fe-2S iron-sulfur cluster binding domain-containing protein [Chloroflexi bacterium]|nr:2Fe-2S iron-sulfur cluster binding domain-containing protein [Chloroflexota bacterium]
MWQTYYTPTSIEKTLELLGQHNTGNHDMPARIIAGGTDLLVELQRGERQAHVLIDVTRIGGLDQITFSDDDDGKANGEMIHVGPMVTHNQALSSELLIERGYPLALACWRVGTPQLRNRGTIAGNLITASPANDTITALWALDARLTLQSTRGARTLSFSEFYHGVRRTALAPDEMVTDIAFPALRANQRGSFAKLALRRAHAIAVVNVAVLLTFGKDERMVTEARITMGSVAPTIVRATEAEAFLLGTPLDDEQIDRAAGLAIQSTACIDDVRSGGDYRRQALRVLIRRTLTALRDGTEREQFPPAPPKLWSTSNGHYPRVAGKTIRHQAEGPEPIECTVNGENVVVQGAGGKTLLAMLREDLALTGTKEGCGEGECGACTVWMDGIAVLACLIPAPRAHGAQIVTVEGLAYDDVLHPVQQAFIDEGAIQCGFCTPGFVMAGANMLEEIPDPTREQIVAGLTGNLCRCTGYYKIVRAIERTAQED